MRAGEFAKNINGWPTNVARPNVSEAANRFRPIDHANPPLASPLLREPLATMHSGSLHPEIFATLDDPDLKTFTQWVEMEIAADPEQPQPLAEGAEQFFAHKVVPILSRKTCFGANCHGPMAFMDLRLDPGLPALAARFTGDIHRANRMAMLGKATRLVNLAGDIEQSKQLLKNIPLEQGGIVHKGGNNFFEKGDPDYEVLRRWLELESAEMSRRVGVPLDGQSQGIVFVRRPRATPERFFEDGEFLPGADLIWQRGEEEINLTAALHPEGPADIRAPSVSYDARQVAFAMRRTAEEPFNIWELQLDSRRARQLTFSTEPGVHFLDPLYVPDPDDKSGDDLTRVCLVMTSNLAGALVRVESDRLNSGRSRRTIGAGNRRPPAHTTRRNVQRSNRADRARHKRWGESHHRPARIGSAAGRPTFSGKSVIRQPITSSRTLRGWLPSTTRIECEIAPAGPRARGPLTTRSSR